MSDMQTIKLEITIKDRTLLQSLKYLEFILSANTEIVRPRKIIPTNNKINDNPIAISYIFSPIL